MDRFRNEGSRTSMGPSKRDWPTTQTPQQPEDRGYHLAQRQLARLEPSGSLSDEWISE